MKQIYDYYTAVQKCRKMESSWLLWNTEIDDQRIGNHAFSCKKNEERRRVICSLEIEEIKKCLLGIEYYIYC